MIRDLIKLRDGIQHGGIVELSTNLRNPHYLTFTVRWYLDQRHGYEETFYILDRPEFIIESFCDAANYFINKELGE